VSGSFSSLVVESSLFDSSGWLSSAMLVACTSILIGPRNGLWVLGLL